MEFRSNTDPVIGVWRIFPSCVLTVGVCAVVLGAHAAESTGPTYFTDQVKPLLDSRCISCHGPDKQKGGLRLDSREAVLKGGESGPALIPGKPESSLLLQTVMHAKPDLEMPPKEKLTPKDIGVIKRWIIDGAQWPVEKPSPQPSPIRWERELTPPDNTATAHIVDAWSDPRNPIVKIFNGQRLDLWSFRPIRQPPIPPVANERWSRNAIDHFILTKLASATLKPSPDATRHAFARRVYYDLTGLPPTSDEMTAFLSDQSDNAYETLVDKLLASPKYGEHWARQWLDVIRYSDSNGFDWDEFRPRAWRFRDYVIRSFNADKPFNQFITEQLAGDELVPGEPKSKEEQDCWIATGYLRLGPQDNSSASFNEQARSRAELMSDLVETTGSAFLGLTLGCCRCHNHKFDPLSQADHFRMRAFFEPAKYGDEVALDLAPEQSAIRNHNARLDKELKPLVEQRDGLLAKSKNALRDVQISKLSEGDRALLLLPKEKRTNELKDKIDALEKKIEPKDKEIVAALNKEEKSLHDSLGKKIDALKKEKRAFMLGLLMTDSTNAVPATHILYQGDYRTEREEVQAGFPSALDPNAALISKSPNGLTSGRRLALAHWITSPANPLTARVLANRVWQTLFGRGLVATPNDFGLAGARPSHPELLDWLATELVRNHWSLKHLTRMIVTSSTYRQAASSESNPLGAKLDAENHLLWRQNLRRLSAEQLRDSLLSVSGQLNPKSGGPPVWPELPPEILQANPAFLDDNAEKTKGWYPSPQALQNVRSIYLVQKKTVRVPFMETFDLPENSTSCPRRIESIVSPQALSLLNGLQTTQAAHALATEVSAVAGHEVRLQVVEAFRLALLRSPSVAEAASGRKFLEHRSLAELCRALLNLNEFIFID